MRRQFIIVCLCLAALVWAGWRFVDAIHRGGLADRAEVNPPVVVRQFQRELPNTTPRENRVRAKDASVGRKARRPKTKEHAGTKTAAADELFNSLNVLRIQIEISPADVNVLRGTSRNFALERPTVMATVREGGGVYTNVAVHLKGSMGSFRPVDSNPALTLNFQKFAPGQSFHGLHKLSLNNSVQDRSFLSEKICRELFAAAGVPAARAAHATVTFNGRNIGLHVLTEGFNKQFLRRFFTDDRGNLYDGGFLQDITARLVVNSGDSPQDDSGLRALAAAAQEPDPVKRLARLEKALDMDQFLSFIALEVMLCHWDGYAMHRNNWRIFHDLDTNRMVFIPHGMDQMFGFPRVSPECPILPNMEGMVAAAVVSTEAGQRRYLERMAQLYTNVFHVEAILQRVDEVAAAIRPVIVGSYPSNADYYDGQVQLLKRRIARRDDSLKLQLASAIPFQFQPLTPMRMYGPRFRGPRGFPDFRQRGFPDFPPR